MTFGKLNLAVACCVLALGGAPLSAVPIQQFTALPATDRTEVNGLEQIFFDSITQHGSEQGMQKFFASLDQDDRLTAEILGLLKQIDERCGTVTLIERFKTESFGSRGLRDTFIAAHGSCFVKWELTYAKRGATWAFDRVDFRVLDGNVW